MSKSLPKSAALGALWRTVFVLTLLSIYLYVLIEWLFVVTKPSVFNFLSIFKNLEIYLFTSALLTGLAFGLVGLLWLVSYLPGLRAYSVWLVRLAGLVPMFFLASLALMVIDNFTYNMLVFGISTSSGVMRLGYALLFVLLLVLFYRAFLHDLNRYSLSLERLSFGRLIIPALIGLMLISLGFSLLTNDVGPGWQGRKPALTIAEPFNVLYLSTDGLQTSNMSVYGYERETTPFLEQLAPETLFVENMFTNASSTSGSLMSALTGKYPAEVRVLNAPDILRGANAFEHITDLLHRSGYYTAQYSMDYYADAYALNLLQGFDEANGRHLPVDSLLVQGLGYLPVDFSYFLLNTITRLTDRLAHIFFIHAMGNPYDGVNLDGLRNGDIHVNDFLAMLETTDKPFFVQLHLINTHGPQYYVGEQIYSVGKPLDQQANWDSDFYDDSIIGFDKLVASLVDELKRKGLYERTILVIGSDHAHRWDPVKRIPLMIRFPNAEHAGRVQTNSQIIDIPVTVLDYLQAPVPDWMDGRSLLQTQDTERPIFVASTWDPYYEEQFWENFLAPRRPPFYQFDRLSLIHCQRWYLLTLSSNTLTSGLVEGSTAACPAAESENLTQARTWMMEHLRSFGFDVSSLAP